MNNKFARYRSRKRRAVSPVIATLLLIAIAVAAAIIVYSFVTGLIGGLSTGGNSNQLTLTASFTSTGNVVVLTVKNTGSVATANPITSATDANIFVNGVACANPGVTVACPSVINAMTWSPNAALSPGQTATLVYTGPAGTPIVAGTTYNIRFTASFASGSTVIASATATAT